MAVVAGVTIVPNARIAGVALTGLRGHKTVAAMGKTLKLDGGKRILRKQKGGRTHKSDDPFFHTFLHAFRGTSHGVSSTNASRRRETYFANLAREEVQQEADRDRASFGPDAS